MLKIFRLAALLALATAPLSAPHAGTALDGGLLVTRVNSEQWELQLIGGNEPRQFTGTVISTKPFFASSARRESSSVDTPSQLSLTLNAVAGGTDVVRFSVALDAAVCLQGSGTPIYIGGSLDDAVVASAPVALHGIDACGRGATALTSSTTTATVYPAALDTAMLDTATALVTTTRKFNKGHYVVLMSYSDGTTMMAASIKPGVKGFMKRYLWKELEPTQGTYNFSEIQADLTWCAARGLQLIVMVEDKTFNSSSPAPAYLAKYAAPNAGGGYTMIRWDPTVVARFKALLTALGRFDSNKAFEGLATQETAPSLSGTTLKAFAYSPEKYRDAYIAVLSAAGTAMPTSRVFWFVNFIPGNQDYIAAIATAVASKGVLMGGPDVAPDNYALQTRVYPYYDQLYGKLPMFGQVEGLCYEHLHATSGYKTKYWTMTELYRFAKTNMYASYMFWVRLPKPSPVDSNDYFDALPVIQTYPTIN